MATEILTGNIRHREYKTLFMSSPLVLQVEYKTSEYGSSRYWRAAKIEDMTVLQGYKHDYGKVIER